MCTILIDNNFRFIFTNTKSYRILPSLSCNFPCVVNHSHAMAYMIYIFYNNRISFYFLTYLSRFTESLSIESVFVFILSGKSCVALIIDIIINVNIIKIKANTALPIIDWYVLISSEFLQLDVLDDYICYIYNQ